MENKKKHINGLMLIFSIIGGIIAYVIGEAIISNLVYKVPNVILVGIYFSVFALCVSVMCLIAELISQRLTGYLWKQDYLKHTPLIIIATVIVMFVVGVTTQFIYGLNFVKEAPVPIDDYVFLMDNSGSMLSSDSDNVRIEEVNKFIDELDGTKRVAYYAFSDDTERLVNLQTVTDDSKASMHNAINTTVSDGGTNIQYAIETALADVKELADPNRKMAIVLVSDGEDAVDIDRVASLCNEDNIMIDTVGFGVGLISFGDGRVLSELADSTDGNYYDIQSVDQLDGVFSNIKQNIGKKRLLLAKRHGRERTNPLFGTERVLFIAIFGVLMGIAVAVLFDNRQLFKNLAIGGAVTGVSAGLLMELGMYLYMNTRFCRFGMDVLLSIVCCLFTGIIAYAVNEGISTSQFGGVPPINTGETGNFGQPVYDPSKYQF